MNTIIVLVGASGVGKTTIAKLLLEKHPDISLVQSWTSRDARENDLPGEYRYHVSPEEFEARQNAGEFLWVVQAHGNRYGTLESSVDDVVNSTRRKFALMILTPEAMKMLHNYVEGKSWVLPLYVFIGGDIPAILRERMEKRGDNEKEIQQRIADCLDWQQETGRSDVPYYFVDNSNSVEDAITHIEHILSKLA